MASYNILLLGDRNAGKSVWVTRLTTGEFEKEYFPSEGNPVTTFTEKLNNGRRPNLHIIEVNPEIPSGHYLGVAHAAIILIDGTLSRTKIRESHAKWYRAVTERYPDIPLVVATTKCDLKQGTKPMYLPTKMQISTRSCFNLYKPLEVLLKELIGPTAGFAFSGGETELSVETMKEYERMLREGVTA